MSSNYYTLTTTVRYINRLTNTVNGGPRYEFVTDQGVFRSAADTQFVHELPNTEFMVGKRVDLTLRNMQCVIDLKVLDT